MPTGRRPTGKLVTELELGIDARDVVVAGVGHPDGAAADGDAGRAQSDVRSGPKAPVRLGLMRVTLLSRSFATQTDRLPNAIADGVFPATIVATTRRDTGSIRKTLESPKATQTDPAPTAMLP